MTEGGYVDSGKLKIDVEADLRGFARKLRTEVNAASRGVTAKVKVDVDSRGLRTRLRAAAKEAKASIPVQIDPVTTGLQRKLMAAARAQRLSMPVDVDPQVSPRALREKVRKAAPRGVDVPINTKTDPKASADAKTAQQDIAAALRDVQRQTLAAEAADRRLVGTRRGLTGETLAYRRALQVAADARTRLAAAEQQARSRISSATDAGVDTAAAQARLALLTRPRRVTINVDADTGAATAKLGALTAAAKTAEVAGRGLSIFGSILDAAAVPVIIGGVAVSLTGLAGAAISVVGAMGPAVEVIGLLPAAAGGALVTVGALVLGLSGLGKALKAVSEAQASAGADAGAYAAKQDAVRAATEQVANAQANAADSAITSAQRVADADRTLAERQGEARQAQLALTQARKDARQAAEDLALQVRGGALAQRAANLAQIRAKQELDKVLADPAASKQQRDEAQLAFEQAKLSVDEQVVANKRLAEQRANATKAGVEGSNQVRAAQARIASTAASVADAERGALDARRAQARQARQSAQAIISAQRALARATAEAAKSTSAATSKAQAALAALSPAARKLIRDLLGLKPAAEAVRNAVQQALLDGVGGDITLLARTYLGPRGPLRTALTGTAAAINAGFRNSAAFLNTRDGIDKVRASLAETTRTSEQLARLSVPLTRIALDLWKAGAPFVTRFATYLADGAEHFADLLDDAERSGKLTAFFTRAVDVAGQLWRIVRDLAVGVVQFFGAGATEGQGMLDTLEQLAARFREWTGSKEGQESLKKFFRDTRDIADGLAGAVSEVASATGTIFGWFHKLPEEIKKSLGPLSLLVGVASKFGGPAIIGLASRVIDKAADKMLAAAAGMTAAANTNAAAAGVEGVAGGKGGAKGAGKGGALKLLGTGPLLSLIALLNLGGDSAPLTNKQKRRDHDAALGRIRGSLDPQIAKLFAQGRDDEATKLLREIAKGAKAKGITTAELQAAFKQVANTLASRDVNKRFGSADAADRTQLSNTLASRSVNKQFGSADAAEQRTKPFIGPKATPQGAGQQIGGDFTAGFQQGLLGGIPKVTGAGGQLTGQFLGKVRGDLGIKSPSTVAAAIGGYFIDGLVLGIARSNLAGRILTAISPLAGRLAGWAGQAFTGARDAFAGGISDLVSRAGTLPGRAVQAVSTFAARFGGWAGQAFALARDAYSSGITDLVRRAGTLPGKVLDAVKALPGQLLSWATGTLGGVRTAFTNGVTAIGKAWDGIKAAAKKPIEFVVKTVINGGLLRGYNDVVHLFDSKAKDVQVKWPPDGWATGGKVWGPGTTTSDSILGRLSRDEHVWTAKEVAGAGGHQVMEALRGAARRGMSLMPGYALGGPIRPSVNHRFNLVPQLTAFAHASGVPFKVSSGLRDTNDLHGRGEAIDMVASPPDMIRLASWLYDRSSRLLELIHSGGPGFFVKNGVRKTAAYFRSVVAEHFNHVHLAMSAAGLAGAPGAPAAAGGGGGIAAMLREKITGAVSRALGGLPGGDSPFGKLAAKVPTALIGKVVDKGAALIGRLPGAGLLGDVVSGVRGLLSRDRGTKGSGLPGAVTRWTPQVMQALRELNQPVTLLLAVLRRINFESSGNPNAINLSDSNARAGHPSQGLMQTIPSTFAAHAGPYLRRGITDPLANIYAGLHYALGRYGSIAAIDPQNRPFGYDSGGWLMPGRTVTDNRTRKPEAILTDEQWRTAKAYMPTFAKGGPVTPAILKAAAEILAFVKRGGALFEDFSFRGSSRNVGATNDTLATIFERRGGGRRRGDPGPATFLTAFYDVGKAAVDGLVKGMTGSLAGVKSTGGRISSDLRAVLGIGAPLTKAFARENKTLIGLAGQRDALTKRIVDGQAKIAALTAQAGQARADITAKVAGSFQLVGAGAASGADFVIAKLQASIAAAKGYTADLATLGRRGLAQGLVQQITDAGVDGAGTARALANATDAQLAQINALYGQFTKTAGDAGKAGSDALYAAGIRAGQGLVSGLLSQRKHIEDVMFSIASSMASAIKKALGIRSPARVMVPVGRDTVRGIETGLLGQLRSLNSTVGLVSGALTINAPVPMSSLARNRVRSTGGGLSTFDPAAASAGGAGWGTPVIHVHPRTQDDETSIARKVSRELAWMQVPR